MADTLLFLDIDGVKGEATTQGFENLVEIESLTWGLEAKHTEKDSKLTTELRPQRLTLTKFFDRGSTNLYNFMSQRKLFTQAKFTFASVVLLPAQKAVPILEIFLDDGYVEDIRLQASESGNAMSVKETVQLSFRKFEMVYYQAENIRNQRSKAHIFSCDQPSAQA